MRRKYLVLWISWGAAFGVIEYLAVVSPRPGGTLSELVWAMLGLHSVIYFLGAGFLAWLVAHFLTGGKV